jgi:glutamine amidotransferase-like uncharacterized protein
MYVSRITHEDNQLRYCLDELVGEVNKSNLTIYCYVGDKTHSIVYDEEIELFKQMLAKANLRCSVVEILNKNFSPSAWNPKTSILYIPGAKSAELDRHLRPKIVEIQEFVNLGGKFIGWCAGGYWACRRVSFKLDEQTTLEKIRDLAFWKGVEEGPLFPCFEKSERNIGYLHRAVKIKWSGSEKFKQYFPAGLELKTLLSGGGSFIPAEDEHEHKVLAIYGEEAQEGKTSAAVMANIGKGNAILMNPYFTYGAEYFKSGLQGYQENFPQHDWQQIVNDLQNEGLKNMVCFVDMLYETTIPQH